MSETTKKKRAKSTFHGGLEGSLDSGALVVLLMGLGAGIWALFEGGSNGILWAVTLWIVASVSRLVLRALADCIRLQKKSLNLPYGGKISEAQETVMHACSECGAALHSETRCDSCGRTVQGEA